MLRCAVIKICLLFLPLTVHSLELDVPEYIKDEYECMVRNLHHEARGEGNRGMIAVANVVMNRVNHPNFPDTICGVIYQRLQFSWVHQVKPVPLEKASDKAKFIAYEAIVNTTLKDNTDGALFFHTRSVNPRWNNHVVTKRLGNHIFYRFRGNRMRDNNSP